MIDSPGRNLPSCRRSATRRALQALSVSAACLVLAIASSKAQTPASPVEEAWLERSTGFDGDWAEPEPIGRAIAALDEALAEAPEDLDLHQGLMRALYYQGTFTELTDEERKAVFGRGTEISTSAMELLHGSDELRWKQIEQIVDSGRSRQQGGALHYWAAILWGSWGDHHGAMAALRKGVAGRLRVHGQVALELAPDYDFAGPYRFLGRMHAIAPKVPGFTGWIDRDTAVELLEEGYRHAPEHPQNQLFLVEIWLDRRPEREAEAHRLLDDLLATEPRPEWVVEDTFALRQAQEAAESSGHSPRK